MKKYHSISYWPWPIPFLNKVMFQVIKFNGFEERYTLGSFKPLALGPFKDRLDR
jgi:hypothetical protein